jgi:protein phosphatase
MSTTDTVVMAPNRAKSGLHVEAFGLTNRGRVRESNEDQFLVATLSRALAVEHTSMPDPHTGPSDEDARLLVVADGMGGHQGGERASALAIDLVEKFVLNTFRNCGGRQDVLKEFHEALRRTDAQVCREASRNPDLWGMGTTLTLAYIHQDELFVVHVGDSRCYLFRDHDLHRITHDHTLVQEMVRRGALRAEDAERHQWRHVITNVVGGTKPGVQPEVHRIHLESGDAVLLCSDGLTDMVTDDDIAAALREEHDPQRVCERLVAQANEHGGQDNITVVVGRFD